MIEYMTVVLPSSLMHTPNKVMLKVYWYIRKTTLIWLLSSLEHVFLSGTWFGVAPRNDTKMTSCVQKRLNYVLKIGNAIEV